MSIVHSWFVVILETIRLPGGSEQYVLPTGCKLSRTKLEALLKESCVAASHRAVQPGTGREGIERIVVLRSQSLSATDQDKLRIELQRWLLQVDSVIQEVAKSDSLNSDNLPTSKCLAEWQAQVDATFGTRSFSSSTIKVSEPTRSSRARKLIAMSAIVLLMVAATVTIPPFFPNLKVASKNQGQPSDSPVEEWNLTQKETFSGVPDLLAFLRPLIRPSLSPSLGSSPVPKNDDLGSDETELADLLYRINRVREEQPIEAEGSRPDLKTLLGSDQLKSYVKKLFPEGGEYDHFGIAKRSPGFEDLQRLLPPNANESTASMFRSLAYQLIGDQSIRGSDMKLSALKEPFSVLVNNENAPDYHESLLENIPKAFRNGDPGCTFFTSDDCEAAKHICNFFRGIEFLNDDKLGFESSEQVDRLAIEAKSSTAAPSYFSRLLLNWQEFKYGQSPANQDAAKPSITDNE